MPSFVWMLSGLDVKDAFTLARGRWQSDEVFRYLHTQSRPLMAPLSPTMLQPYA